MPGGNGVEETQAITGESYLEGTRVVALTMFELDDYVYGALKAGASASLLKDATPDRLADAVRRVHAGESPFAPLVMPRLVEHYVAAPGGAETRGRSSTCSPSGSARSSARAVERRDSRQARRHDAHGSRPTSAL